MLPSPRLGASPGPAPARLALLAALLAGRSGLLCTAIYNPLTDILPLLEEGGRAVTADAPPARGRAHKPPAQGTCTEPAYVFVNYTPSAWEADWLANAPAYEPDICGTLWRKEPWVKEWVEVGAAHQGHTPGHEAGSAAGAAPYSPRTELHYNRDVFSTFTYRRGCSAKKGPATLTIPIEPAVGHLRHPYWDDPIHGGCKLSPHRVSVDDRDYLLPGALTPAAHHALYPGRALLLDLGTGPDYASSLAWLVDTYARRGIHFDEIWTWEVTPNADHAAFWEGVPPGLRARLHYYNTGVATGDEHPFTPMNLLRELYAPGDFVVMKVDVEGNKDIEGPLMRALMTQELLPNELFYEYHYGEAIFHTPYENPSSSAFQTFHHLRSRGVRIHYWP